MKTIKRKTEAPDQRRRAQTLAELKARTPLGGTPIPPKVVVPAKPSTTVVPVKPKTVAVGTPDNYVDRYLDAVAPASITGRLVKFDGKDGKWITSDDGVEISEDTDFVALLDETLVGYARFNGPGVPPDRIQGLLYDGFILPPVESLPDRDESQWEIGLSGKPVDPYVHQMCVVLQQADTQELFTVVASNPTGRRAVGQLLKHYNRLRRSGTNEVPIVRLRKGGYHHSDRVGWVVTPMFVVFGKVARDSAARPDTSLKTILDDEVA